MVTKAHQKIIVSGYYGFRNSGDEAVLSSILYALEEAGQAAGIKITPVVLSIDPEWTTRVYGVESVHRMKLSEVRKAIKESDGLISGGGSLLQDVTGLGTIPYYLGIIKLAQWLSKPTFIYAQGVGPVTRGFFHPFIRSVMKKCKYISVRDEESAKLLSTIGIKQEKIEVVPDPVMGFVLPEPSELPLQDSPVASSSKPVIGVSVRFWNEDRSELLSLAKGLSKLTAQREVTIKFLPFHFPGDDEASRFVIDHMDHGADSATVIGECEHPSQMVQEVKACDLLIGMRLHSLIYAASQNIPMMGISYDPKIDQFLARLNVSPVGNHLTLDSEKIVSEAEAILTHREEWITEHQAAIEMMTRDSRIPAGQIVRYLTSRG